MNEPIFYILDVFAEEKYAGNQLAVCRNVKSLSDIDMQRIAKEMNFSETTFVLSEEEQDGGYDVRIFTPEEELPFAGHPTLGTAHIIMKEVIGGDVNEVILNLKVGQIPVTTGQDGKLGDVLWMNQKPAEFGPAINAEKLVDVLGLRADDIDGQFPLQIVSTGVPVVIVPLKGLDALKRARVDRSKYFEMIRDLPSGEILIFCPEARHKDNNLSVRFFAESLGVPEDPATGSANGCLAGYLVRHRYFNEERIDVRVEQGYEIGRPSLLLLKAGEKDGGIDIHVGGKVIMVARGELV